MESQEWSAATNLGVKDCVSIVIIWDRFDFHKKHGGCRGEAGSIMQKLLDDLSECSRSVSKCDVFESRSTLDGNQARVDVVFNSESEAREFNLRVNRSKNLPSVKLAMRTFLFSEEELGYKQEPVLTELDILHIVKFDQLKNLFRHFLTCKVVTDDNKIVFRFNSTADVNLFLYNKCRDPNKRTIGMFRQDQEQLRLLPDRDGMYSLMVTHEKLKGWDLRDLEKKFKFGQKILGGSKYFQFENKVDLYTYFASEDAKNLATVEVHPAQIIADDPELLKQGLTEEQMTRLQLAAVEKELKVAKVDLAKKEALFNNQKNTIEELRKELERKLTKM